MSANQDSAITQAESLLQNGQYQAAFGAYNHLLAAHLTGGPSIGRITWVLTHRTASLAQLLGQFDLAITLLGSLDQQFRQADRYSADYAALERILVLLTADRVEPAYQSLQALAESFGDITRITLSPRGLDAWESSVQWANTLPVDRAAILALFYRVSATILRAFGQYSDALTMNVRGLEHAARMGEPALRLDYIRQLELDRVTALIEQGDFANAESHLSRLQPQFETVIIGYRVRWRELHAQLALLRGEFGTASADYRALIDACQNAGLQRAALLARLNLIAVLININQTALARSHLAQIEAQAAKLGDQGLAQRCHLLQTVIDARSQLDQAGEADPVSVQQGVSALTSTPASVPANARQMVQRPTSFLVAFDDRVLDLQFALAKGDLALAAASEAALRQAFGKTDSVFIRARLQGIGGLLAYYQRQYEAARSLTGKAYAELERIGARPEAYQSLRVYGWCLAHTGASSDARAAHQRTLQALLEALTATLSLPEQAFYLLNKWTEEETELARTAQQLVERQAEIEALPALRRLWARREFVRQVYGFMHQLDFRREAETVASVPNLLRWLKMRHEAVIGFFVLPDRTYALTRTWLGARVDLLALPRLRLRDEVRGLHEALSGGHAHTRSLFLLDDLPAPPTDPPETHAEQIARLLGLGDLLRRLPRRVRTLTVVPDDALHGVPLSALAIDGTPLVERYAVSHAYQYFAPPRRFLKARTLFSAGEGQGNSRFAALPGTARELAAIGDWARTRGIDVAELHDAEVTPDALMRRLPQAALAHIACHGVFTPDDPDATGLVLIPTPGAPEQIISLPAVRKLALGQVEHLVLSSCWSADYYAFPGRHILSLPETFLGAGVGLVLGSLWEVEDTVAVAFMRHYYTYLETLPCDEALRRTQQDARLGQLGAGSSISEMRQWASFQLYGSYGSTRLRLP